LWPVVLRVRDTHLVPFASFATLQDLDDEGIPLAALASIPNSQKQRVLDKVSSFVAGYIGDKIQMPLIPPYDPAIVTAVVQIAVWRLLVRRGFNPEDQGDRVVRSGFNDAMAWLKDVANGKVRLEQKGSFPESLQPSVDTNEQRGFGTSYATDPPFIRGTGNFGG
jgi:phage gp36-like protein